MNNDQQKIVGKRFDKEAVVNNFLSLIPDVHPSRQRENTRITITSHWKRGELTKLEINGADHTGLVSRAKERIVEILLMTKRFKRNYSGSYSLIAVKKRSSIDKMYFEAYNRIFEN